MLGVFIGFFGGVICYDIVVLCGFYGGDVNNIFFDGLCLFSDGGSYNVL